METKKQFCRLCGKQMVEEKTNRFDPDTGKPAYRLVCPDACKHGQHDDQLTDDRSFPWSLFKPDMRCKRCGRTSYLGD